MDNKYKYTYEKTPHVHCVVVPLIQKYDKRTNTERYTISKKPIY